MRNKRSVLTIAAVLALGALLTACGTGAAAQPSTQADSQVTQRTITVVGQGEASGMPDIARVQIGVETRNASAQEAVQENRDKMNAVLEAIKALGIADKDIQTTNFSIYTDQQPVREGQTPEIVYRVSNMVSLTVRDISMLGDVLDAAVSAGANQVFGVSFDVADRTALESQARQNAVADAKARADSLAQLTGVQVGAVQTISEQISQPGPVFRAALEGLGGSTPIQPGELRVSVSVQIVYAIQ